MNPIRVLLCSDDEEYLRSFAYYVRTHEQYCTQFSLILYSELDRFKPFLRQSEVVFDICLCEQAYFKLLDEEGKSNQCLLMRVDTPLETSDDQPFIMAYKPVPEILQEIIDHMRAKVYLNRGGKEGCRVYAIGAASGGAGCTTVALHLAKQLGKHSRICYFSFETMPFLLQDELSRDPLAEWLYYDREDRKEDAGTALEQALVFDEQLRAHVVVPFQHLLDRHHLPEEMIERLINAIVGMSRFDAIIIDLQAGLSSLTMKAFELAHQILWLFTSDLIGRTKATSASRQMQALTKQTLLYDPNQWIWVHNKAISRGSEQDVEDGVGTWEKPHVLPYIPSWKQARSIEDVWNEPIFTRHVASLATQLWNDHQSGGEWHEPIASVETVRS